MIAHAHTSVAPYDTIDNTQQALLGRTLVAQGGTKPTGTWSIRHAQRRSHHELSPQQ